MTTGPPMPARVVAAATEQPDGLRLVPLKMRHLQAALRIARGGLPSEWGLVALTYGWHLLRTRKLMGSFPIVARKRFRLLLRDRVVGSFDVVSSLIHGDGVRWILLDCRQDIAAHDLAAKIFSAVPSCRLAVVVPGTGLRDVALDDAWVPAGGLPGPDDVLRPVYSIRREAVRPQGRTGLRARPVRAPRPQIDTQFFTVWKEDLPIALTGLYSVDWWPHIGWGGWGAIDPQFVGLHAITNGMGATEQLARRAGHLWYCVETTRAPEFRFARGMYGHRGMRPVLEIGDFFLGGSKEERTYVIYGMELVESQPF